MNNPYKSPPALQKAIADRARKQASSHVSSSELTNRFYIQRLMARVFLDDSEGWLLKGGQALLVRHRGARHSRDLDLLYRDCSGLDEALTALRHAAQQDLGDFIHFEFRDAQDRIEGRPSRKVRFDVQVGRKKINSTVSVDLVTGLAPLGDPVVQPLQAPLDIDLDEKVLVQLYPLNDHIADKICAMYETHSDGKPSSRVKDLVDLIVIALNEEVDGHTTQQATRFEFERRRNSGADIMLPASFVVPEPRSWSSGYRKEARTVAGLEQYRALEQARPLADRFVSPLLAESTPGHWQPTALTWN